MFFYDHLDHQSVNTFYVRYRSGIKTVLKQMQTSTEVSLFDQLEPGTVTHTFFFVNKVHLKANVYK